MPSQVMGMASTPHGYLGLGVYKYGVSLLSLPPLLPLFSKKNFSSDSPSFFIRFAIIVVILYVNYLLNKSYRNL